jgi:predicted nucleic acid-binding protein
MKVIVDSCVWSLLFRRRNTTALSGEEQMNLKSLTEAIGDGRAVIIGPIRQEVLSGIGDLAQFEKLRNSIAAFPDEPLTTSHYEEAVRLFNLCRSRGVECGSTDILICAVAARMQCSILTYDQGLIRCIGVLKAEGLMQ